MCVQPAQFPVTSSGGGPGLKNWNCTRFIQPIAFPLWEIILVCTFTGIMLLLHDYVTVFSFRRCWCSSTLFWASRLVHLFWLPKSCLTHFRHLIKPVSTPQMLPTTEDIELLSFFVFHPALEGLISLHLFHHVNWYLLWKGAWYLVS
jgi:hypothetical protein